MSASHKPLSLLDQVLKNKDTPSTPTLFPDKEHDAAHILPDGSEIFDSTIMAFNRIYKLNPGLHKRAVLFSGAYQMYNRYLPVDLSDKQTFLSLIKADFQPATPYQAMLLLKLIEEYAPVFSRDLIQVSEDLVWDTPGATLRPFTDEERPIPLDEHSLCYNDSIITNAN